MDWRYRTQPSHTPSPCMEEEKEKEEEEVRGRELMENKRRKRCS